MLKSWRLTLGALWVVLAVVSQGTAQTSGTGAIAGSVTDSSGAVIAGAQVTVTNLATGQKQVTTTHHSGDYVVPLLSPGKYSVEVRQSNFKVWTGSDVTVTITETATVNAKLQVGSVNETVQVKGSQEDLQTESAELGHVTGGQMIESLPLVSRNYTQIIALNPGISAEITNAGDLGRGESSYTASSGGFSANGGATNDNNFQMNGLEVNDNFNSGAFTGGIPTPNPDTLQEFKVLTGQYDASYGRNSGAEVNVLTKTGSNEFHGSVFEFLRNDVLNANEWFNKKNEQPRGVLKQNQFGFTFGGPLKKDKLLFFGSYQGTRQRNGISPLCSSTVNLPPLTNDRSAAALGALFAGQRGLFQDALGGVGPAIAADGSNINPIALKILQMKAPNGGYLIPTPQSIDTTQSFDAQGTASFSTACPYNEDQFMTNLDFTQNDKSRFQFRFFFTNSLTTQTLPSGALASTAPGFPNEVEGNFRNFSLTHTYTFTNTLLNQFEFGFNRTFGSNNQSEPFTWSDLGASVPDYANPLPNIGVANIGLGGQGQTTSFAQNTWILEDSFAWVHGRHSLRFGGGGSYNQVNEPDFKFLGGAYFITFADFLLGLNANDNGTAAAGLPVSNEYLALGLPGILARHYRYRDFNAYVQDDIKISSRFTFNVGVRFEHLGSFGEINGRNTGLDLSLINPNPPDEGTLAGFVVPDNYPGTPPPGVTKSGNNLGIKGDGQNTFEPRVGFAWQLPGSDRFVLRAGYGMFRSRGSGVGLIQSITALPWSDVVLLQGPVQNADLSLQQPLPQTVPNFPEWKPYSPTSSTIYQGNAQNWQPSIWQRYSLDLQSQLAKGWIWDVGYVGSRGTKLFRNRYVNQAALASATNPIRGETTNTIDNIPLRVPFEGWDPLGTYVVESSGGSWYNGLQTSLNKRFSHGLTFLASYTFARDLTDVQGVTTRGIGGTSYGDQNNSRSHYGPEPFVRPHRFVASYAYQLPGPHNATSFAGQVLGGWGVSGVTVYQSGHRLFAVQANPTNVYGIPNDRAEYVASCDPHMSGSVQHNLNEYFNTDCFTTPPVIGDDGVGTDFGNAPIGNIHGPSQLNFDLALVKNFPMRWPREGTHLQFRAEFFNLMNHPQFGDPDTAIDSSTYGRVLNTVVNPRVIQFALKLSF